MPAVGRNRPDMDTALDQALFDHGVHIHEGLNGHAHHPLTE